MGQDCCRATRTKLAGGKRKTKTLRMQNRTPMGCAKYPGDFGWPTRALAPKLAPGPCAGLHRPAREHRRLRTRAIHWSRAAAATLRRTCAELAPSIGRRHTAMPREKIYWPLSAVPAVKGVSCAAHLALALVCGADFLWKLMCGAGPGDLGGSRGSTSANNHWKSGPKSSSQTAFRYPAPGGEAAYC